LLQNSIHSRQTSSLHLLHNLQEAVEAVRSAAALVEAEVARGKYLGCRL
jgi:hypothetical protein